MSSIELKEKWGEIIDLTPTRDELQSILRDVKLFKEKALQRFFNKSLTHDDLRIIVENVEPLKIKAEKILKDKLEKSLYKSNVEN